MLVRPAAPARAAVQLRNKVYMMSVITTTRKKSMDYASVRIYESDDDAAHHGAVCHQHAHYQPDRDESCAHPSGNDGLSSFLT